jgi:hypothetical protein
LTSKVEGVAGGDGLQRSSSFSNSLQLARVAAKRRASRGRPRFKVGRRRWQTSTTFLKSSPVRPMRRD